jgi:hypothetical protein
MGNTELMEFIDAVEKAEWADIADMGDLIKFSGAKTVAMPGRMSPSYAESPMTLDLGLKSNVTFTPAPEVTRKIRVEVSAKVLASFTDEEYAAFSIALTRHLVK